MYSLPRRSRHNVNLWIVPLKMSIGALLLFAVTLTLDLLADQHRIHLPDWFSMGGIDDARAILGAMLGCVSTVLALIFSVALLVLSMVANLFGPRLLYRFVQDWVTQVCIGLFMGAFIYVFLVFLVTHSDVHSTFIPQVSLIVSWFLVLGAFGFLVFYSHRVAVLIQNPDAIGRIVDDLRRVVDANSMDRSGDNANESDDERRLDQHASEHGIVLSRRGGYVQLIHHEELIAAASALDALVVLKFRPGQFVLLGECLATVSPASQQPELSPAVRGNVSFGRHRVLEQDVEFGIAQIVEIAIRALSPAINDTFTGVACVDLLGESLTIIAKAPEIDGRFYDSHRVLRLQVRPVPLPRLIKQAFDQIRQAAADNPAVSIRLLSIIGRLAGAIRNDAGRAALLEQAEAVWESANSKAPIAMDRADLRAAWEKAHSVILAGSSEIG